ncbi:hypothetical protein [Mycoplasmopsis primatum]|uniref:hypothetical protein n=1 Tax=Mycoplasmopsis primatum TaxID=55604 RepID=UPI000562C5FF|nr:hypothetical protein [Mycoplasmopsis primatum]
MQKKRLKKSLIFVLPAVLITTTAPLASVSCGGGKYSYLNEIKFNLINPSITTNKEIVDEFKKNKQSLKKYIEISNPNKYKLEIKDVESVGNSAIKILIKTSQNGKNEYSAWTQPISGLKDPSKAWEQNDLELLSKVLLDQIKNKPKDLIDLQSSKIKDKFPSTIDNEMIQFKPNELISNKLPEIKLVANIDPHSKDDVKGTLSLSLKLKNKKGKLYKITKNNITLSTNDGLLSLDDLASKLTVNDLDLPTAIGELLPSKFEFESNDIFNKDSILKKNNVYSNVEIQDVSYDNKDPEGIKIVSFKLKHKNQLSKLINLTINQFYSTKQFDELVESLTVNDLDINIDPTVFPSNFDVNNIQLKKDSLLLAKNPNLRIKSVLKSSVDDNDGLCYVTIELEDTSNKLAFSHTNLLLSGFAGKSIKKQLQRKLDDLVDKIQSTPIKEGKYILFEKEDDYDFPGFVLWQIRAYKTIVKNFQFNQEKKGDISSSIALVPVLRQGTDKPDISLKYVKYTGIKPNVQAMKFLYNLSSNGVLSNKTVSVYIIATPDDYFYAGSKSGFITRLKVDEEIKTIKEFIE